MRRPFPLTLALLVPCVGADHSHDTFAANDFAISADFPNRCSYFHDFTPHSLIRSANLSTLAVVAQVGFLHHALVLMTHCVRLHLRHEVHCYDDEN